MWAKVVFRSIFEKQYFCGFWTLINVIDRCGTDGWNTYYTDKGRMDWLSMRNCFKEDYGLALTP